MSISLGNTGLPGSPVTPGPGGQGGSHGTVGSDPYRAWAVGRIAALIRGARSEPDLIPVVPERRRLRNLMNGWLVAAPLAVVLFEVVRRILAHYFPPAKLEGLLQPLFVRPDSDSIFYSPFLYFSPAAALSVSMILTLVGEGSGWMRRSTRATQMFYLIAVGMGVVAAVLTVVVAVSVYFGNPYWFAAIVLACFYVVPLAHLAYMVISILTNSTRSLVDYGVGLFVFIAAVFAAFSIVIGADAIAASKMDAPSGGQDAVSTGLNYWILVPFSVVVLAGAGVTMWNYHRLLRWLRFGKRYADRIDALAKDVFPVAGGLGAKARNEACAKIGQRLGQKLSGSPAGEYSVYVCGAAGPLGLRLSSTVESPGHEILDPAVSAGIRGVHTWVSVDKRAWTMECHQYLYIQVSEGLASHLYDSAVSCGRRWPFGIDADVLACSRLLAMVVADAVYRSGVHRLMPRLAGKTSWKDRAIGGLVRSRIWWRQMGVLCVICEPFR